MWLSSEFLNWYAFVENRLDSDDFGWKRAYEIWTHAEQVLDQHSDEFHLVDVVTTLKRAMTHRLQLLKNTYIFDAIPVRGTPQRTIEQLAFWGIVRPTMLVQLIHIRNAVEHQDATPPTQVRCKELLDFVWYFLRSTDRLAGSTPSRVEFVSESYTEGIDNTYDLELAISPQNSWKLEFAGWINASALSESRQDGWLEIQLSRRETRDEVRSHVVWDSTAHENRKADDLRIEGTIIGPESKLRRIFDLYFELAFTGF